MVWVWKDLTLDSTKSITIHWSGSKVVSVLKWRHSKTLSRRMYAFKSKTIQNHEFDIGCKFRQLNRVAIYCLPAAWVAVKCLVDGQALRLGQRTEFDSQNNHNSMPSSPSVFCYSVIGFRAGNSSHVKLEYWQRWRIHYPLVNRTPANCFRIWF